MRKGTLYGGNTGKLLRLPQSDICRAEDRKASCDK